jgi:hypothetical protein
MDKMGLEEARAIVGQGLRTFRVFGVMDAVLAATIEAQAQLAGIKKEMVTVAAAVDQARALLASTQADHQRIINAFQEKKTSAEAEHQNRLARHQDQIEEVTKLVEASRGAARDTIREWDGKANEAKARMEKMTVEHETMLRAMQTDREKAERELDLAQKRVATLHGQLASLGRR